MRNLVAATVATGAMLLPGGAVGGSPAASPAAPPTADTPPVPSRKCDDARRGLRFYRTLRARWHDRLGRPALAVSRDMPADCDRVLELVEQVRARARADRKAWRYLYAWREWLPANWEAVARCETGINWEHVNSSFVSAFGISWREYDADARYMGAPPWRVRHTPRDQYLAALGHYARFGDGWSCPGP